VLKILQSRGQGVRRGTNSQFPESTKTLKAYDLVLGSLLFLTKVAPSGRFRINIFADYSIDSGKINITKALKRTVSKLSKLLLGRVSSDKLVVDEEIMDIK